MNRCGPSIALTLCAALAATDWPQWRGPLVTGHAEGPELATTWPAAGPSLLWHSDPLPRRRGAGCPAVAGGRVYVHGTVHAIQPVPAWALHFYRDPAARLSPATIAQVETIAERWFDCDGDAYAAWQQEAGIDAPQRQALQALWKRLYDTECKTRGAINRADDEIRCLDATNGRTLWQRRLPGLEWRNYSSNTGAFGYASTCCVIGDRCLVLAGNGIAHGLDCATGATVWTLPDAGISKGGYWANHNSFIAASGGAVLLAHGVWSLDPAKGTVRWHLPSIVNPHSSAALWQRPGGDAVVVGHTGPDSRENGDLIALAAADGKELWRLTGRAPRMSSPVVGGGFLAVAVERAGKTDDPGGTGTWIYDLSAATPRQIVHLPLSFRATPVLLPDRVLLCGQKDTLLAALPTGEVLWRSDGKAGGKDLAGMADEFASPVASDGKLLCANSSSLRLFDISGSAPVALAQHKGRATAGAGEKTSAWLLQHASPALADGRLYVQGAERLLCFDLRAAR